MSESDMLQSSEEQNSEEMESKGGKSSFGSDSSDSQKQYSGVEMEQGEVLKDSDWNEAESNSSRELEEATIDPTMRIEETGSYKESEAIEAAVTDLIDTGGIEPGESLVSKWKGFTKEKEIGATPQPIPHEAEVLDKERDLGATPQPIPYEADVLDKERDITATPQPIPNEADEIEYVKISPEKPSSFPPEIAGDEAMLDGKGNNAQINPETLEEVEFKFFREADQPTEMPPELSEKEITRKRPGKEGVEFKFYKPIPADEEVSEDREEDSGRGA